MKTELSSLDLYFLIKEFQLLVNAKIDKIFQKNNLLQFQIHIPNKGKKHLTIKLPSLIYLSNTKYRPPLVVEVIFSPVSTYFIAGVLSCLFITI